MRIVLALALVSSVSLMGSVASAQDRGGSNGNQTTSYDFDDDIVTGDLVRPDGEVLRTRRRGQREALLRVREHFVQEMLKSVENL